MFILTENKTKQKRAEMSGCGEKYFFPDILPIKQPIIKFN